MNLVKYKEAIQNLRPLTDSQFPYNVQRWQQLNPDFANYLASYQNRMISRQDVINSMESFYRGETDWEEPFLLTMVWGFADVGYGTFRTNKYVSDDTNRGLIRQSLICVKTNKLKQAYEYLYSIDGLSISYISKILYFASRACNHKDYALIFDVRVARSLILLSAIPEVCQIVKIMPSEKFEHYKIYNSLIHKHSRDLEVEAEALEMFLFNQNFTQ